MLKRFLISKRKLGKIVAIICHRMGFWGFRILKILKIDIKKEYLTEKYIEV